MRIKEKKMYASMSMVRSNMDFNMHQLTFDRHIPSKHNRYCNMGMDGRSQRGPDHGHQSGTRDFCDVMGEIEQPDPHRDRDCPPEKGWR